jgi:hypothetical protein
MHTNLHYNSFVEANLLIMCCCLSTLRRFFKHFAPRLIGEASSTGNSHSCSRGFSNHNAQRTFGSGGAKRNLDSFMHTANDRGGIPLSSFDGTDKMKDKAMTKVKGMARDSDSEEAILFERSVQVTYEDASRNGSSGAPLHQPKIWTT